MRSVPILETYGSPTSVELQDALPLDAFLAPVSSSKDAIASALESLEPCENPSFSLPIAKNAILPHPYNHLFPRVLFEKYHPFTVSISNLMDHFS